MKDRCRKWFARKNLNEQLRVFFTVTILAIMILMLVVFTISAVCSLYRKSEEQASAQLGFMAASYLNWMESAYTMMQSLEMDDSVQSFCSQKETEGETYQKQYTKAKEFLDDYLYVNGNVNFIAIINGETGKSVFSGKQSITFYQFGQIYEDNYADSIQGRARGTFFVNYSKDYYRGKKQTMTFYRPVYSSIDINRVLGVACINMDDFLTSSLDEQKNFEICMTDLNGRLIFSDKSGLDKKGEKILDVSQASKSSLVKNGKVWFCQKIAGWNYYLVSIVPFTDLFQSSIQMAVWMAALTVALLIIGLKIIRTMIERSYQPLRLVIEAMDMVAEHKLDFRIDTEHMGRDFEKLGNGYNEMMDDIQKLMEEVREEQRCLDQIRLNMLQSQIQPHFLYNTLDCIHWQARADGNRETSELVMALARYYRICLSKGKELIPLRQELEHISCYLLIQNKRYGNIIDYEPDVDETFLDVKIPKLTLQPLVENSIYHGIRIKDGKSGAVGITAKRVEKGIQVAVVDSGCGMSPQQVKEMNDSISDYSKEFGYGVRNVNKRIELTFGVGYGLHYQINSQGGVTVEILLREEYEEEADLIFLGGGRENHV